jgi:hypothetical protein
MDGFSGYNQIQIHPIDQYKTAFTTPWGTFAYRVMPFGLKNAGATFQWAMTYIFHDLAHIILTYLDDLTARSKKCTQHLDDLRIIFQWCRQYNIRLNPLKCIFCVTAGCLLRFIISQSGITWTPSKSKLSPKFHLPGIYVNSRAYKERLTFYSDLSQTTPLVHMVSFAYYATTSHFTGMNMPKSHLTILKWRSPMPL